MKKVLKSCRTTLGRSIEAGLLEVLAHRRGIKRLKGYLAHPLRHPGQFSFAENGEEKVVRNDGKRVMLKIDFF